jgi:hypothetical protein
LLALGIGANTAIFSFVNAVLLKQLPVVDPTRLVTFSQETPRGPVGVVWSLNALDEVSKQVPASSGVFGWALMPVNLSEVSSARWVKGEMVTGQYFRTLQVRAAIGRLLSEDDVRDALGDPVCVLSYGFWQRGFGGDPAVVGRTVQLNGQASTLVAAIGLHGLLALSVSRRARELGIRMAVGVQRRDVVTLFGRESFVLVLIGIGIGVPLALVSARLLGSLLFGVPTNDPLSLAGSIAVLLSATLLATLPSLWRASRFDPATAIRRE